MSEPTKRVKLKANGQEMIISARDFREDLHEDLEKSPKQAQGASGGASSTAQGQQTGQGVQGAQDKK